MASGQRRSWPIICARDRLFNRAFEAEDADDIPDIFHIDHSAQLTDPERVSLHQRLRGCRNLGRNPPTQPRMDGHNHFTIEGRRATFLGPQWTGPPSTVMAECGLIKFASGNQSNWATCYCCSVTFRNLAVDVCVWTLHRKLSPNCRHLQRARAHGIKPRAVRVFARRFSTSSSMGER